MVTFNDMMRDIKNFIENVTVVKTANETATMDVKVAGGETYRAYLSKEGDNAFNLTFIDLPHHVVLIVLYAAQQVKKAL